MSPEQKQWLENNPEYSPVQPKGVVSTKSWTDEGYLFPSGTFIADDGETLFAHKHSEWFPNLRSDAIRVGRHYDVV